MDTRWETAKVDRQIALSQIFRMLNGSGLQHVWLTASIVMLAGIFPVQAQERFALSFDDRKSVISLVESSVDYQTILSTRRVLCELSGVRTTTPSGRVIRQAIGYYFEYRDGSAIRAVVDLDSKKILELAKLEAYCPPLAPEERIKALDLAISKIPEVRALYDQGADVQSEMMPSVVSDKQDQRFGHRIVRIILRPTDRGSGEVLAVTIDLTSNSLVSGGNLRNHTRSDPSATIEQLFPLNAASSEERTGWRITFGTTKQGRGEILIIQKAFFKRSKDGPWIQMLGDCRLAEMFVPYNNGFNRYYDITGVGGTLIRLAEKDFGPACLTPGRLYLDDKVAFEMHDGHNLWMDHYIAGPNRSRRVEEIHLWSVMPAGNYAYPMLYVFRSDGSVGLYASATAHNLTNDTSDDATHLHMGCWRLNITLGDPTMTRIETVRFESSLNLGAKAKTVIAPFNGGKEGGIAWKPEEFLRLRITSTFAVNDHDPPNYIAYELVPVRLGNGRTFGVGEEWTGNDLWVSLPTSSSGAIQDRYRELPRYVANSRSIDSHAAVIWCQSALVHRPRDEDFGKVGYDRENGVALTSWTGFELKPRNAADKTPLYP